jgi:hypothetical protein
MNNVYRELEPKKVYSMMMKHLVCQIILINGAYVKLWCHSFSVSALLDSDVEYGDDVRFIRPNGDGI